MFDQGRISSIGELEALKGQYICLVYGAPHIIENRELLKPIGDHHIIYTWKVGNIIALEENNLTEYVVCWHYDNPNTCFSLKDFNILPNDYNNHTAWVCPKGDEIYYEDDGVSKYSVIGASREDIDKFKQRNQNFWK